MHEGNMSIWVTLKTNQKPTPDFLTAFKYKKFKTSMTGKIKRSTAPTTPWLLTWYPELQLQTTVSGNLQFPILFVGFHLLVTDENRKY